MKITRLAPRGMAAVQAIAASLCILGLLAGTAHVAQLTLAWTDASTNEDGFKIERATGTTGAYGQLASVAAGTTAYVWQMPAVEPESIKAKPVRSS